MTKLTIIIPTRNRASSLALCLASLAAQTKLPEEVIIINNASSDETTKVIANFSNSVTFEVREVIEKKIGYSFAYNKGLKTAKSSWIALLNDDCIASQAWLERVHLLISRIPEVAVIAGANEEWNCDSMIALANSFMAEVGFIGSVEKSLLLDFETLDTKNCVFNVDFLKKNRIEFNEKLQNLGGGSSEDSDIGMQIFFSGGIGIYDDKMIVKHQSVTSFQIHVNKLFERTKDHLIFQQIWKTQRKNIYINRPLKKKIGLLLSYKEHYSLSSFKFTKFCMIVLVSYVLVKLVKFNYNQSRLKGLL